MDKSSSVVAAINAGKLPSTQQFNHFVDYLNEVGLTQVEPDSALTAQGRLLADDLRQVLDAYKQLANYNNADNILQEAIYHLAQGDITSTKEASVEKEQALKDLDTLRGSILTLLRVWWSSYTSEGSVLYEDLLSLIRTSLADAAETLEEKAGYTKDQLRKIESEVQEGKRDPLGRDKERLEQEKDPKVAWEHGMDTVKDAGVSVIGTAQGVKEGVKESKEQTEDKLKGAYYSIWERAQADSSYREALDNLLSVLQTRLHKTLDLAGDPDVTLTSLFTDPTAEQHIPKAFEGLRALLERVAGTSLDPLIATLRKGANVIIKDEELSSWFDEFLLYNRKCLGELEYAHSKDARTRRHDLRARSKRILEKDDKWRDILEGVKSEWGRVERGVKENGDLKRVSEAQGKLGLDVKNGLRGARDEIESGVKQAIEEATWFWQDLFKVYLPKVLQKLRDVPIPRTEYKDEDIEFVLENLDISSFNVLPSHVFIRNITDVDIQTSPSSDAETRFGGLTHIQVQAIQLDLKDVSFWYKDKHATVGPAELTGLLGLKVPPQGVSVDLKVRLIPENLKGAQSRESLRRFNVVELASVNIHEDVEIAVRESNHPLLVGVFKPLVRRHVKEALEKTLGAQVRGLVEWADGVAWDVRDRKRVFEDVGVEGGGAVLAALWSEIGKLERDAREVGGGGRVGLRTSGTGLIVEEKGEKAKVLAVGVEPQVLGGEKRGPVGTGSEPIAKKVGELAGDVMDVDLPDVVIGQKLGEVREAAGEVLEEGKKRVEGFRKSVENKQQMEKRKEGWKSEAFDFA